MNLSIPALSAAAAVLITIVVAAAGHAWWQHRQLTNTRDQLAEVRTQLVLCQTDKKTLATSLAEQSAEVRSWEAWGARVQAANAAAMAAADTRRQALERALEAAQQLPAGSCEQEAEELGRWADSLDS